MLPKEVSEEYQIRAGLAVKRPFCEMDRNYIFSTWLKGLCFMTNKDEDRNLTELDFHRKYQKILESIVDDPGVTIEIMSLKENRFQILGFCVWKKTTLHWVYTRPVWRKMGIATSLLPKNIKRVSFLTNVGKSIMWEKLPEVKYVPYEIRGSK